MIRMIVRLLLERVTLKSPEMRKRNRSLDYLQYLFLRFVSMAFAIFPIEANLRTMRWLGNAWFSLPHLLPEARVPAAFARIGFLRWSVRLAASLNRLLGRFREHRNRAEGHIRMAFPDMTPAQVSETARRSFQQLAMLAIELLHGPRYITTWNWARHVRLTKLDEAIRVLLDRRGCIMLTGHYGNWEILGYTLATLGFDIVAVMRPLDNEFMNRHLVDSREKSGLKLLYKKGATRSAGDVIDARGALCFIADQNAGHKGMFVDFFGKKASTYKSIGLLAMEYKVPIIVGCARRISDKFEYEIRVNRIIRPEEWRDRDDPLFWITSEYSKAIEDFVRVAPEQYLWIHRRWKSRPKSESQAEPPTENEPIDLLSGVAAAD